MEELEVRSQEKDNVLMICKKGDSSAQIRKFVNEVQLKYGEDFI